MLFIYFRFSGRFVTAKSELVLDLSDVVSNELTELTRADVEHSSIKTIRLWGTESNVVRVDGNIGHVAVRSCVPP